VSLVLLLALARTTAAPAGWALAGAAFALALLGRELVLPFGALVLVWMAWRTALTRSMESATGLLYIELAVVMASTIVAAGLFFGEGLLV